MRSHVNRWIGVFLALAIVPFATAVSATVRTVRMDGTGDYAAVVDAVLASADGDTIEVGPGTYHEPTIDINHELTFLSTDGKSATVLDGLGVNSIFRFLSGPGGLIQGFKFQNGFSLTSGAAILVGGEGTVIVQDCVFENNHADYNAGAIYAARRTHVEVHNCGFYHNSSLHDGGAASVIQSGYMRFSHCAFYENATDWYGGALCCGTATMDIENSVFVGNRAEIGSALYAYMSAGLVEGNTLHGNVSEDATRGGLYIHASEGVVITKTIVSGEVGGYGIRYDDTLHQNHTCCLFWGNDRGDIGGGSLGPTDLVLDPLFCDPPADNYTIAVDSPCAPANNVCGVLIGALGVGCGAVPVALSDLRVTAGAFSATLEWELRADELFAGFEIYRSEGYDRTERRINDGGLIPAHVRRFTDNSVRPATVYRYRVAAVHSDGTELSSSTITAETQPSRLELAQNEPNPFNPSTTIGFSIPEQMNVVMSVYDVSGKLVKKLLADVVPAGRHDVGWDGRDQSGNPVGSGVYFVKLDAGGKTLTRKMVMVR